MAETVVAPPRAKSKKGCFAGCAVALLLALIGGGVVGLFVLQAAATQVAQEALNQYAQAQSWDVTIGLTTAPKLFLGQPVDIGLEGHQVLVDKAKGQVVERIVCNLQDVAFDRASKQVTQLANGTFELAFTSAQLDAMVQQRNEGQDLKLSTEFQGTNLFLKGETPPLPQIGTIKFNALCAPEIVPPTSFKLSIQDVQVELPGGLKIPGLDAGKLADAMKQSMSQAMVAQLVDPKSGLVFETANIEGDELIIKGHLTAEALAGGQ